MTEVHSVLVQLRGSTFGDAGQVTTGYYMVDGDTLIMTYADGKPIDEYLHRHQLQPGDNAKAIAGVLTKKVRMALLGFTEDQDAFFSRRLDYPQSGIA